MSIIGQNILAGSSGAAAYTIDQSCRFDDGGVQSISKSFASDGDLKTWTLSMWFKRGNLYGSKLNTDYLPLFEVGGGNGNLRIYSPTGGNLLLTNGHFLALVLLLAQVQNQVLLPKMSQQARTFVTPLDGTIWC